MTCRALPGITSGALETLVTLCPCVQRCERTLGERPRRNGGVALELALGVDSRETAVPKLYPETLQPNDSRPDADPARRATRRTTRKGGPEPAKRATNPRAMLPQRDSPARKVPRSGPTSQPKGRLNPSVSDRPLPPDHPGSQSDAAAAQRIGAGGGRREYRECAGKLQPTGTAPAQGHPGAETASLGTTHHDSDSTPKAYRLGLETTTRPVGCFRSTPTGTTHCMEQRLGRVQDP